jgi:hypothetical protein
VELPGVIKNPDGSRLNLANCDFDAKNGNELSVAVAAVLAATQILVMLEFPIRHGRHDVVPGVVERGHRALDELNALR